MSAPRQHSTATPMEPSCKPRATECAVWAITYSDLKKRRKNRFFQLRRTNLKNLKKIHDNSNNDTDLQ